MTPKMLCRMVTERTGAQYAIYRFDDKRDCWCLNWIFDNLRHVGMDCTPEFLDDMLDGIEDVIADAVAVHIRRELQKAEGSEPSRSFYFDRQGKYHFPANNGEDFDFFEDERGL